MAYPLNVKTRLVSFGGAATVEAGIPLHIRISTESSRSLIWVENGYRLESLAALYMSATDGQEIIFEVPTTDQNGWLDAATRQAIIVEPGEASHLYTTKLEIFTEDHELIRTYEIGPYAVPEGPGTLDADLLNPNYDPIEGTLTVYIPGPDGELSAAGQQAAADAVQAAIDAEGYRDEAEVFSATSVELQDAAVAALIDTPGSETQTQLNATFADKGTQATVETGRLSEAQLSATIGGAIGSAAQSTGLLSESVELHQEGLRKWYAALANRSTEPVQVLVLGDSNSEGTGATKIGRRWQNVLQDQLRRRFQPADVDGAAVSYVSAGPRANPLPDDYPVTNTGGERYGAGLGLRAWIYGLEGEALTFTFTGDQFQIFHTKGTNGGRMSITIDGGTATVVDTWQTAVNTSGHVWTSPLLAPGAHTVVVSRQQVSTQQLFIEGFMAFNGDQDAGIRVIDGARHGSTVSTFAGASQWQNAVKNAGPFGLCIMPWGANDSTSGTTPTTFRTNVEAIITSLRTTAEFDGSVLLVGMPKRGNATEQTWSDYRAELKAIADADADVSWFDLRARMPDRGTPEAIELGLYADEVHYNDKGQSWIADQIASAIMPR